MNRAYKFRLKPTEEQASMLLQIAGNCRWIWNQMLAANIAQYQLDKTFIWSKTYQLELPKLKMVNDWLKLTPSQSLQQKCDDLEKALKMTTKSRAKRFGFPKFKSKSTNRDSFRIPQSSNKQIKHTKSYIQIPKMGKIAWIKHREIIGVIKSVTIKQEASNWYVSVLCELPDKSVEPYDSTNTVGIDFGLTTFATLSNGVKIETQRFYRDNEKHIKQLQRQVSRKKKGSNNRKKAIKKLQKKHKHIQNKRLNFLHNESRKIANSYKCVIIEDLDIAKMKRRFGKSVADQGWATFVNMLQYKTNKLIKIDRYFPSSQICSGCGQIHKEMKSLSIRTLKCDCGTEIDRDINAAINISAAATAVNACGVGRSNDIARATSKIAMSKQEKLLSTRQQAA